MVDELCVYIKVYSLEFMVYGLGFSVSVQRLWFMVQCSECMVQCLDGLWFRVQGYGFEFNVYD